MKDFTGKYGVLMMVGGMRYVTRFGILRKNAEKAIRHVVKRNRTHHAMLIKIVEDVHIPRMEEE